MLDAGAAVGWIALAAVLLGAALVVLRKLLPRMPFIAMHRVLGYAALVFSLEHVFTDSRQMGAADTSGIWLATGALCGIVFQIVLGTNLAAPGVFHVALKRWHRFTFIAVVALVVAHVAYDAPWRSMMSDLSRGAGHRPVVGLPGGLPTITAQHLDRDAQETLFCAGALDSMIGREQCGSAARRDIAEETAEAAFVRDDVAFAFSQEGERLRTRQLPEQNVRDLKRPIFGLSVAHDAVKQFVEVLFPGSGQSIHVLHAMWSALRWDFSAQHEPARCQTRQRVIDVTAFEFVIQRDVIAHDAIDIVRRELGASKQA